MSMEKKSWLVAVGRVLISLLVSLVIFWVVVSIRERFFPSMEIGEELTTISGQVLTEGDLKPLEGVRVELSTGMYVETDHNGSFVIQTIAGPGTLTFSKQGYLTVSRSISMVAGVPNVIGGVRLRKDREN